MGHLQTKEGKDQDWSEDTKKARQRGALACWRGQREELIRTTKESGWETSTHNLERTEGGNWLGDRMEASK